MTRFSAIITALMFLSGCTNDNTIIKGEFQNAAGETVVLERLEPAGTSSIDSSDISDKGRFELDAGIIASPGFYRIRLDKNNFVLLLLAKAEKAELTGNAFDLYSSYEVTGSKGSEDLRGLDKAIRANFEKIDSAGKVFRSYQGATGEQLDSLIKSADEVMAQLYEEKRQIAIKFINEHPTSLASLSAVQSLSPDRDMELFEQVEKQLSAALPESEYVKSFRSGLADLKAKQQASERLKIGAEAPEIALQTPEGNTIRLSDFRGKITLIDFWASWCKPCRVENPNVVKTYEKFKNKGLEIFGVSLDKDHDKWTEAIQQDGLTWKHGSELKFWQSSFVPIYNLDGIPMNYLIDENGIILAKGLHGEELMQKLEDIFH